MDSLEQQCCLSGTRHSTKGQNSSHSLTIFYSLHRRGGGGGGGGEEEKKKAFITGPAYETSKGVLKNQAEFFHMMHYINSFILKRNSNR